MAKNCFFALLSVSLPHFLIFRVLVMRLLLTSIATIFKAKIPASEHKNGAKVKQIKRMHECQLKQKLLPRTMVVVAAAR